jgi:hypothetical protein
MNVTKPKEIKYNLTARGTISFCSGRHYIVYINFWRISVLKTRIFVSRDFSNVKMVIFLYYSAEAIWFLKYAKLSYARV